jgi:hypothetical protein
MEVRDELRNIESIPTKPLTANEIYSQLGNKTQSENVILPEDLGLKYEGQHKSNMWTVLAPNFKKENPFFERINNHVGISA